MVRDAQPVRSEDLHPLPDRGVTGAQLVESVTRLLRHDHFAIGTPRFVGPLLDGLVVSVRRPHQ
jgi:hypothetical protein